MKVNNKKEDEEFIDFDELIKGFVKEYGNIFFADIQGNEFVYKALSRKTYKTIFNNPNISDIEKEDEICKEVILWPKDFDFDDCDASVPTQLCEEVINNSCLNGTKTMIKLLTYYRQELDQLDNQMTCIISEAFPNYDILDIESWDMIKFLDIYSKAEYKLKTLRNYQLNIDVVEFLKDLDNSNINNEEHDEPYINEHDDDRYEASDVSSSTTTEIVEPNTDTVQVGSRKMTKEQYQQYQEMIKKIPEIDWGSDAMFTGYESISASTVAPALR